MDKLKRTAAFIYNHPLGGKHPAKSLLRFLHWQLQIMLQPSKLFIKPFIGTVKFYARKGLTGITGNIYTGLHEFNDMAFLLHFLRPGDVFFDIGANVGSYTLLAAGFCRAKAIAIEPAVNTAAMLNKNVLLNQLQNQVTLINAAAGAATGELTFTKNEDTTNHVVENEPAGMATEKVKVIVIDSLTKKDSPALIKIDVEGFETEVLKGMLHTLKQETLKAIIIELNGSGMRYGFNEQMIHALLGDNGFKPYRYNPFNRGLEQMDSYGDYNTIYCRDIGFIGERIKSSAGFNMMGEQI